MDRRPLQAEISVGLLPCDHEVRPAVPLPRTLIVAKDERALLTVTDGGDAIRGDPGGDEVVLYRLGSTLAEAEVVFGRSPLIAVAFERDLGSAVGL